MKNDIITVHFINEPCLEIHLAADILEMVRRLKSSIVVVTIYLNNLKTLYVFYRQNLYVLYTGRLILDYKIKASEVIENLYFYLFKLHKLIIF